MLDRFFPGTASRSPQRRSTAPTETSNLRRVGTAGGESISGMPTPETAANDAVMDLGVAQDTLRVIDDVGDVGTFRAVLVDHVPASLRDVAMVLDCGLGKVKIVAVREAMSQGQYHNIQRGLTTFMLDDELLVTPEVMERLRQIASGLSRGSVLNEDQRGLQLYEDLVRGAHHLGASDLHILIDTEAGQSRVKLRLFGRMRSWQSYKTDMLINALRAAYGSISKKGTNSRADFTVESESSTMTYHEFENRKVMGRLAHRPVLHGGKTVVRLLETTTDPTLQRIKTFEELGYERSHIEESILPALKKNVGLVLLAGSTGSGKSTTLRTMMWSVPGREGLEMYSVEDPTEYVMPWVNQISIQSSADDTDEQRKMKFLSALRSMMRMDPDVAMIGEIRDTESAKLATEMGQTGHRVFSTVHGEGVVDVLSRLTGDLLQVPPDILATKKYLSASMYQRLLPKLCPSCRLPAKSVLPRATQEVLQKKFGLDVSHMYTANKDGCQACRLESVNTEGTKGQTVVAEILVPNDAMRFAMKDKAWPEVERLWRTARQSGFGSADMKGKTAFEHALYKAAKGVVDPLDIEIDFEPFETYQIIGDSEPMGSCAQ